VQRSISRAVTRESALPCGRCRGKAWPWSSATRRCGRCCCSAGWPASASCPKGSRRRCGPCWSCRRRPARAARISSRRPRRSCRAWLPRAVRERSASLSRACSLCRALGILAGGAVASFIGARSWSAWPTCWACARPHPRDGLDGAPRWRDRGHAGALGRRTV